MKRVVFDVLLISFIFLLPWWVTLIFAILGLFIFVSFYEFLIASVLIYTITSVPESTIFNIHSLIYFLIVIFYLMIQYLRRFIILYKNEISYKK